jgi:hypothetical protein
MRNPTAKADAGADIGAADGPKGEPQGGGVSSSFRRTGPNLQSESSRSKKHEPQREIMKPLTHNDLLSLEQYARERAAFRTRVLAHKRDRKVRIGEHVTLLFEDRLTIQYQIQEMLRAEKIFEPEGIAEELDSYNPLIPDGSNLKCTMLIEYDDVEVRKRELLRLRNIEHEVQLLVEGHAPSTATADEDLPRSNDEKTAAVHFLRFELDATAVADFKRGATATFRIGHANYRAEARLTDAQQRALTADLD